MTNANGDKVTAFPDHLTEEIGRLKPRLRDELTVTFDDTGSEISVVIEDPANGVFFRLGYSEYAFASMLNGQRSISDVVASAADNLQTGAFNETQAAALTKWLIDNNLVSTSASTNAGRVIDQQRTKKINFTWGRLNPISTQIVLGNPAKLVRLAETLCGWMFTRFGLFVWFTAILMGVNQVIGHSERVQPSLQPMLASSNLWIMLATWLILRLAHEGGHAVAARRWGAEVHEAGLAFILFVPLPFVNLTSSWKLQSKWQRIAVAAAGMYVELFLAAIAACIWSTSVDPVVRQYAMNVVIAAGLTTLLFNLNPLMKFDGYYMLSDLLNLPNLATHAQEWQQQNVDRLLLGKKPEPKTIPPVKRLLVSTYALAGAVWKIIICISLATAASVLFAGAGLALSCISIGLWTITPMVAIGNRIHRHCQRYRLGWVRPSIVTVAASLLMIAGWNLRWQPRFTAPVVVGHDPYSTVRTTADGFVEAVLLEQGEAVAIGTPILRLSNPNLVLKLKELELAAQQSQLRLRSFSSIGAIAAAQSEEATLESLTKQTDELRMQLNSLAVVAESDGVVFGANLRELEGQYLAAGSDVCQIAGPQVLYSYMPQQTVDVFEKFLLQKEDQLAAQFPGMTQTLLCSSASINPTATQNIEHAAVTSLCDNQIPVQQVGQTSEHGWQLVEPHVQVKLNIEAAGVSLQSGRTGVLHFVGTKETIGHLVLDKLHREFSSLQQWRRRLINGD